MVMDAWPRPVALQDLLCLPLIEGYDRLVRDKADYCAWRRFDTSVSLVCARLRSVTLAEGPDPGFSPRKVTALRLVSRVTGAVILEGHPPLRGESPGSGILREGDKRAQETVLI